MMMVSSFFSVLGAIDAESFFFLTLINRRGGIGHKHLKYHRSLPLYRKEKDKEKKSFLDAKNNLN